MSKLPYMSAAVAVIRLHSESCRGRTPNENTTRAEQKNVIQHGVTSKPKGKEGQKGAAGMATSSETHHNCPQTSTLARSTCCRHQENRRACRGQTPSRPTCTAGINLAFCQ